ncbi:MAG TPA: hypothetical protein VK327_07770 [Candidatus Paceibacterota bacterium]|nr:hypothetical protein [Candidatus Paceibacterota bacterium]
MKGNGISGKRKAAAIGMFHLNRSHKHPLFAAGTFIIRTTFQLFSDTEKALEKLPVLNSACFNLGLALLANNRDPDLKEAKTKWLSPERAVPVITLLESLQKPPIP